MHATQMIRRMAIASLLALVSTMGMAQTWPSKPIKIVLGLPAGLAADVIARMYGEKLAAALGQPVLVDNKPGATGNIAQEMVAKSPADGYTLLYAVSNSFVSNPHAFSKLPFDVQKDFVPVAQTVRNGLYLVANKNFAQKSMPELVKFARANPGKYSYASSGVGGFPHLVMELVLSQEKVDIVHVPYRGSALTDVLGGAIQLAWEPAATAVPNIKEGKVQPLVVWGYGKRNPATPEVPNIAEVVPGADVASFQGFWAPAATPPEVVARLNQEISKLSQDPDLVAKIRNLFAEPVVSSPSDMAAEIRRESARWAQVIKEKNIRLD